MGARLAMGLSALLALLGVVAALGLHSMSRSEQAHAASGAHIALAGTVARLSHAVQSMRRYEKDVFLELHDAQAVAHFRGRWEEAAAEAERSLDAARAMASDNDDVATLRKLKPSVAAYLAGFREALQARERGDLTTGAQAREQMKLLQASADLVDEQARELGRRATDRVAAASAELERSTGRIRGFVIGAGAAALVVGLVVGWLLTRSVKAPVARAAQAVRRSAEGDLSTPPRAGVGGEIGQLIADIEMMNRSLSGLVGDVRARAHAVDARAVGMRQDNLRLSVLAEDQASALEQTRAAMSAFSVAVNDSAEAADRADGLGRAAAESAREASEVAAALIDRFAAIELSSRKVAEITTLVEAIAFQTNILALNAAIESARAGESGRAFGVVAAEVRRLSHDSTRAARQIGELVNAARADVFQGGQIAGTASRTLEDIRSRMEALTGAVAGIAVATLQQRRGVAEVSHALSQLEAATRENARLAEHSSTAAAELESVAAGLVTSVSRFRTGDAPAEPGPEPDNARRRCPVAVTDLPPVVTKMSTAIATV